MKVDKIAYLVRQAGNLPHEKIRNLYPHSAGVDIAA